MLDSSDPSLRDVRTSQCREALSVYERCHHYPLQLNRIATTKKLIAEILFDNRRCGVIGKRAISSPGTYSFPIRESIRVSLRLGYSFVRTHRVVS